MKKLMHPKLSNYLFPFFLHSTTCSNIVVSEEKKKKKPMAGGEEPWIEEWAKQELQNLESKHPHHFHFLKADLKSYLFSDHPLPDLPPITTQASSNAEHISKGEQEVNKRHKLSPDKKNKRKSRTEMVIERAEECLKKIRHLKQSFH